MKLLPLWLSIVFLVVGALLVAGGLIIFFIAPGLIKNQVLKGGIIDSKEHSGYEDWAKPPENPLVFSCYFWNISNINEVRNGVLNNNTKPYLQQVGPYVYKRYQERFDVTFLNEDETPCEDSCPKVEYREWGDYVYFPDESGGRSPLETIYVPNVAYWTILNYASSLLPSKLSEEILAIQASHGLLFGGFNTSFTDTTGLEAYGASMTKFTLGFYNGVGPLFVFSAIVSQVNATLQNTGFSQQIVLAHWAYCAKTDDLTNGDCAPLQGALAGAGVVDPELSAVRNTLQGFIGYRINADGTAAADSFANFNAIPSLLPSLWGGGEHSLSNQTTQSFWTDPTYGATFVPFWVGQGATVDVATRIATWRAPSVANFGAGNLFQLVEGVLVQTFFGGVLPDNDRSLWAFLHWGRFNTPPIPGFGAAGIMGGQSLSVLDPATGAKVLGQPLEINLFAVVAAVPQVDFSYSLSKKIIQTFATPTVGVAHIYGHILGWELLLAAAGGIETGVSWPGFLIANPTTFPTAQNDYSLTSAQARLLYHYLKTFYLKNIVDVLITAPPNLGGFGFSELPNALFKSTPKDQLFGRVDPLFVLLAANGFPVDTFVPGVWTDFNRTVVGFDPLALDKYSTGKDDSKQRGQQLTYETRNNLKNPVVNVLGGDGKMYSSPSYYDIDVPVTGSSLTFVGPYRLVDDKNDDDLFLWVPNVVRELKLIYQKSRKLKGIEVYRYVADETYPKVASSPANQYDNPFNFVMNCRRAYTRGVVDIFLTLPHFTLVKEVDLFVDPLDGDLQPNEEEFLLFWDIEPITGLAFSARAPLQVAVATIGNAWNASLPNAFLFDRWSKYITRNTYFPVYYITRTNELSDDQADEWKSSVGALMVARIAVLGVGVAVGGLLIILGLVFLILKAKAGKGDMDEFELRT